jgi:antitoxin ParD1/3/4
MGRLSFVKGEWRCEFIDNLCQKPNSARRGASMATMNVSLPGAMKDWVEGRAQTGRFSNASDYVRDLIRRDQERDAKIAAMQHLVSEALESGVSPRSTQDILAIARRQVKVG